MVWVEEQEVTTRGGGGGGGEGRSCGVEQGGQERMKAKVAGRAGGKSGGMGVKGAVVISWGGSILLERLKNSNLRIEGKF